MAIHWLHPRPHPRQEQARPDNSSGKDQIFYVATEGDDGLIRTARKKLYPHFERLGEVEDRLPSSPFLRIHRSFIVNLNRAYELRARSAGEWELKTDLSVNKVLPVSRRRMDGLKEMLGV